MKIHILSDLHIEFQDFAPPATEADAVVLAGDIGVGYDGLDWAVRQARPGGSFAGKEVFYIAGNHEYYGHRWQALQAALRERAAALALPNLHYLDCDQAIVDGVRFLGCELWTDFQLFGSDQHAMAEQMAACVVYLNDFNRIRNDEHGKLRPDAVRERHLRQRSWLAKKLREAPDGRWRKTVVITHHLPSMQSVAAKWARDLASSGFASNLDDLVALVDGLWIHGHTHDSFGYEAGRCRVICNPRGYMGKHGSPENVHFDETMVVEV